MKSFEGSLVTPKAGKPNLNRPFNDPEEYYLKLPGVILAKKARVKEIEARLSQWLVPHRRALEEEHKRECDELRQYEHQLHEHETMRRRDASVETVQ